MFNLYFAGSCSHADAYLQELGCLRLFSQVSDKRDIAKYCEKGCANHLFIDSGAFSVAHSNKVVDIDKYIDYINSNPQIPIFVELDKIPFPVLNTKTAYECGEISWNNYVYMRERIHTNCHLLPIYHYGEPIENLTRILETPVQGILPEYIGIGGRHGVSTKLQEEYFDIIFAHIKASKNPNVKIHAFGLTVLSTLEKYPFYSADSTTWVIAAVMGDILTDNFGRVHTKNLRNHGPLYEEITQRGFSIEQLQNDVKSRTKYNVQTCKKWADNYVCRVKETVSTKLF